MVKTFVTDWMDTVGGLLRRQAEAQEATLAALSGLQGPTGPAGPQGDPGPTGPAGADGPPGADAGVFVEQPSDVVNATTALVDVGALSLPALPGRDYLAEFFVVFRTSATNVGVALGLGGPAAPVAVVGQNVVPTGLANAVVQTFRAYNTATPTQAVDQANQDLLATVVAVVRNGPNAGAVSLRFASRTAGQAVTVRAGSVLRYRQLN